MNINVMIDKQFEGPVGSANGGYVAGFLAKHIEGPAEITLFQVIPLNQTLQLQQSENGSVFLKQDDTTLVEAKPTEFDLDIPEPPDFEVAKKAEEKSPSLTLKSHPICYGCGIDRKSGDGLRVFAGPVEGRNMVASSWIPHENHVDEKGNVGLEFVLTTLDCPGGYAFSVDGYQAWLLGRISVKTLRYVKVGERCVVIGWQRGEEGRKLFSGTALFSESQDLIAYAKATWFQPPNYDTVSP